jgi:hypothetical protein
MREYTEEVRRAQGLELRIRVGLNSGEVVVRAIGSDLHMDYSAIGGDHEGPAAFAGGGGAWPEAVCRAGSGAGRHIADPNAGGRGPRPGGGRSGGCRGRQVAPGVRVCALPSYPGLASARKCLGLLRQATPYFPVVDLLKRYAHVEDQDDPRTIRAKVTG